MQVYGDKKTGGMQYTLKQLVDGTDRMNGLDDYYLYWQQRDGGYYLMYYPREAFNITYNFEVGHVFTSNISSGAGLIILLFLLLDL